MTPVDRQLALLDEARKDVQTALDQWDAASVPQVQMCLQTLERAAEIAARLVPPSLDSSRELLSRYRTGLLELKAVTSHLERLVDRASAFLRTVSRATAAPVIYASNGRLRFDAGMEGNTGVEG
jgi:hypothetical protein